ncbi:hypothetical protein RF11_04444 [Thelohanellus kitauei]|uniref:Uncharacterized protein n=1 Tax=Thelohanellus kitauei TaxID=669202 RepID=A0A0C2MSL0_THEKT|nr:hypothetical protein RF11_04444 [Thelohanellus kitauei]
MASTHLEDVIELLSSSCDQIAKNSETIMKIDQEMKDKRRTLDILASEYFRVAAILGEDCVTLWRYRVDVEKKFNELKRDCVKKLGMAQESKRLMNKCILTLSREAYRRKAALDFESGSTTEVIIRRLFSLNDPSMEDCVKYFFDTGELQPTTSSVAQRLQDLNLDSKADLQNSSITIDDNSFILSYLPQSSEIGPDVTQDVTMGNIDQSIFEQPRLSGNSDSPKKTNELV